MIPEPPQLTKVSECQYIGYCLYVTFRTQNGKKKNIDRLQLMVGFELWVGHESAQWTCKT